MIETIQNDDLTFSLVKVNGKAIKKSQLNALNKAITKTNYFHFYKDGDYTITGMFSEVTVGALEYSIYTWVQNWQRRYSMAYGTSNTQVPIQTFDGMRYLFQTLCPKGYDLTN